MRNYFSANAKSGHVLPVLRGPVQTVIETGTFNHGDREMGRYINCDDPPFGRDWEREMCDEPESNYYEFGGRRETVPCVVCDAPAVHIDPSGDAYCEKHSSP